MLYIKAFVFSPIQENTYVVYDHQKHCLIIDPGCYFPEEKEELFNFIREQDLTVKMLINTHCHLDHVFGNKDISDKYGLILHLHKAEVEMLEMAPSSGLMFSLPFDNYSGKFEFLKEGDLVKLGDDELRVIEAPGHSPGSICFYCEAQHFIISGDVLFQRSIGRTDLPKGDHDTLIKSIREKLFVLPDNVKVYSGHGPETNIGDEKKYNPFLT